MARTTIITGVILDEGASFSLAEICNCCGVSADTLIEMVEEGVVEPLPGEAGGWRFTGPALRRAQMALRLREDLRVNLAGAALALDLMDELEDLRRRLRRLEQRDRSEAGFGPEG